ncbi:MAG: hypothetical protein AAF533_04595 [Acidobacteriota bacterium]
MITSRRRADRAHPLRTIALVTLASTALAASATTASAGGLSGGARVTTGGLRANVTYCNDECGRAHVHRYSSNRRRSDSSCTSQRRSHRYRNTSSCGTQQRSTVYRTHRRNDRSCDGYRSGRSGSARHGVSAGLHAHLDDIDFTIRFSSGKPYRDYDCGCRIGHGNQGRGHYKVVREREWVPAYSERVWVEGRNGRGRQRTIHHPAGFQWVEKEVWVPGGSKVLRSCKGHRDRY